MSLLLVGDPTDLLVFADLRSWFIQIPPGSFQRRFFSTRCGKEVYLLSGLPMGWKYAPFIAQSIAEGLSRRIGNLLGGVKFATWIDNLLGRVPKELAPRVSEAFAALEKECGCCWKSVETGVQLESLGIEWHVEGRLRLRTSWVDGLEPFSPGPVLVWWRRVSSLLHAIVVWCRPMCTVFPLLDWISALAGRMRRGELSWASDVQPWSQAAELVLELQAEVRLNPWRAVTELLPLGTRPVWGISDASLQARAAFWHGEGGMHLYVWPNPPSEKKDILDWELMALVDGIWSASPRDSKISWLTDSGGGAWILQRFYSHRRNWNPRLKQTWVFLRSRCSSVTVS